MLAVRASPGILVQVEDVILVAPGLLAFLDFLHQRNFELDLFDRAWSGPFHVGELVHDP